ncbi:anhydro-N-acetylmuramic acid kinase, partial [Aurantibacter sp.]|uniref:anhydro-N-acetylmuramic acid kinase n=1 Tax=Aurantibacter sp. TaxID=2807103 RepID=UPI0035C85B91
LEDVLRTFVEHISYQISISIKDSKAVLFTGGGVYNLFLMNRIKYYSDSEIIIPETKLVEFKEALIFGFLGVLKLENQVNCLASVTGAAKNHTSGKIYYPSI